MIPSFLISDWTTAVVGIIYAPRVTSYTLHTITNHSVRLFYSVSINIMDYPISFQAGLGVDFRL